MTSERGRERSGVPSAGEGARRLAVEEAVGRAVRAADRSGTVQLACATIDLETCDPLGFFEDGSGGFEDRSGGFEDGSGGFASGARGDRFYWCRPAEGLALGARGAVVTVETKGAGRFEEADRAIAEAFGRLHAAAGSSADRGPLFVGGFAFVDDPAPTPTWQAFPAARLLLPEVLVRKDARGASATVTRRIVPGASPAPETEALADSLQAAARAAGTVRRRAPEIHPDPSSLGDDWGEGAEYAVRADRPHDVYRGQVAAALRAIEARVLEKVVLARSLSVRHPGRFDIASFLDSLARVYPSCTVLAVGCGDDTLVAATPELLVRRTGRRVVTCAVAGSAPRGRSPEEDAALGHALATSDKEQAEHEAVVRAIRSALADACGPLAGPERPELLRVEGIQHLCTPLEGRLPDSAPAPSVVALAGRLHPTPAVGGLPDAAARAFIARHERLDRGWYAAPVGFVDATGGGEFHVALRSALIQAAPEGEDEPVSHARLFAGAGIVAGSDPDQELRETRLKLRALLAPLTEI